VREVVGRVGGELLAGLESIALDLKDPGGRRQSYWRRLCAGGSAAGLSASVRHRGGWVSAGRSCGGGARILICSAEGWGPVGPPRRGRARPTYQAAAGTLARRPCD